MRLSVLPSIAVVSCGFSVFGGPLAAPQERSDSVQNVPSSPSTNWESNSALPILPTLPTLPNMLADTSFSSPDTTVQPEIKPEVPLGSSGYPSSKSVDLFTSSSGGLDLSSSDTPTTITPPSTQPQQTYPFEFDMNIRESLNVITSTDVKSCIFWLTPDKSSLQIAPNCGVMRKRKDNWQNFRIAFEDSKSGFAVYVQSFDRDYDQAYSIMNIRHPCRDEGIFNFYFCGDRDILARFKPHWVELLKSVFGDNQVRSVDDVNYILPASLDALDW